MPSGGFIPQTSVSPSYLGTYTDNFPNPIKTTSIANIVVGDYEFRRFDNPEDDIPGNIGEIGFYNIDMEGPWLNTGIFKIEFA